MINWEDKQMRMKRAPLLGAIGTTILLLTTILILINTNTTASQSIDEMPIVEAKVIEDNTIDEQNEMIEEEPAYAYNITSDEREMLARLVFLEANTESVECQRAIVSVVINRWQSGYWGNTLYNVVYAPNQFTPAPRIASTTPTVTNYEAVDYVVQNGVTLPSYCLYFRANYHFNWPGYVGYAKIDDVCFGYMSKDKK